MGGVALRPELRLLAAALSLAACTDDPPAPHVVDNLRVLAVRADPPEVGAGDTVALEVLVVDGTALQPDAAPDVASREVTIDWYACPDVGGDESAIGILDSQDPGQCAADALSAPEILQHLGSTPIVSYTVPDDALDVEAIGKSLGLGDDTGLSEVFVTGLLAIAGININVAVVVRAGDEVRAAGKRINVSLAPDPNRNPDPVAVHVATDEELDDLKEAASDGDDPHDAVADTWPAPTDRRCFVGEDNGSAVALVASEGPFTLTPVNIPNPQPVYDVIVGNLDPTADPSDLFGIEQQDEKAFYSVFSTVGSFGGDILKADYEDAGVTWSFFEASDDRGEDEGDVVLADLPSSAPLWIVLRDGRGGTTWCTSTVEISP